MRANQNKAKQKKERTGCLMEVFILLCEISTFAITFFTLSPKEKQCKIIIYVCIAIGVLWTLRLILIQKNRGTKIDFKREQRINAINKSIFDSLYKLNSLKIRSILRHTYGTVPKWNPINYKENILVYDVHEYIRSILVGITDVIIGLDPERFNDRNVSAALIYCYPEDYKSKIEDDNSAQKKIDDVTKLPLKENTLTNDRNFWKLISSGDTSGNSNPILTYLEKSNSFYVLVDCFGTVFLNDKFKKAEMFQMKKVGERLREKDSTGNCISPSVFFISDIHDLGHAHSNECAGSAIGTVINIKNDNPEDVFVKAILTINTYGDPIFTPVSKRRRGFSLHDIDKYGLSVDDYEELIKGTILLTYSRLLEAELSQMYIRHSIKHGHRCRLTGREVACSVSSTSNTTTPCSTCAGCCTCAKKATST